MKKLFIYIISFSLFVCCSHEEKQHARFGQYIYSAELSYLLNDSITTKLKLQPGQNKYELCINEFGNGSEKYYGKFEIINHKIHFELPKNHDTNIENTLSYLNHKPIKKFKQKNQSGIQIKVNNIWYYFEQI